MYSLWRCVRAMSNASSSAARYVLKVWVQLQPSTGFIRCEITTNIKRVLPTFLFIFLDKEKGCGSTRDAFTRKVALSWNPRSPTSTHRHHHNENPRHMSVGISIKSLTLETSLQPNSERSWVSSFSELAASTRCAGKRPNTQIIGYDSERAPRTTPANTTKKRA